MRLYLESANSAEMTLAAPWPFVAGVVTGVQLGLTGGPDDLHSLLEQAVRSGRNDWKLWLGLPRQSLDKAIKVASAANDRLALLTGGPLAGPTLVFKLPPGVDNLWAAAGLIRDGMEVCIAGTTTSLQGVAASWLPPVTANATGRIETEGPPASRNPYAPHFVAVDLAEIDRQGGDGMAVVLQLNGLYGATRARTRILASGMSDRDGVDSLLTALAACPNNVVDLALPLSLLRDISGEP